MSRKAVADGNHMIRAYDRALNKMRNDPRLLSTSISAGFNIPGGQPRGQQVGWQVFVVMARYSQALLKLKPDTGGLLVKVPEDDLKLLGLSTPIWPTWTE